MVALPGWKLFGAAANNALRVDAGQDAVQLQTLSSLSNVTMLGWFRIVNARAFGAIFSFENTGLGLYNELALDGAGTSLTMIDHSNFNNVTAVSTNTWYKVAWIFTSGSYTAYLGTEGSGLTTYTGIRANITGTPDLQQIGGTSASSEWFDGRFAGVRVWNSVLTSAECATEFLSATPVITANLLGAWFPPSMVGGAPALTAISGSDLIQGSTAGTPVYTVEAGPILS